MTIAEANRKKHAAERKKNRRKAESDRGPKRRVRTLNRYRPGGDRKKWRLAPAREGHPTEREKAAVV